MDDSAEECSVPHTRLMIAYQTSPRLLPLASCLLAVGYLGASEPHQGFVLLMLLRFGMGGFYIIISLGYIHMRCIISTLCIPTSYVRISFTHMPNQVRTRSFQVTPDTRSDSTGRNWIQGGQGCRRLTVPKRHTHTPWHVQGAKRTDIHSRL